MTTTENVTPLELAAERGDTAAVRLIQLSEAGLIIAPLTGDRWEVTYSVTAPATTPWVDHAGNLFATTEVGKY